MLLFGLLGVVWLGYWAARPLLVRYALLLQGVDDEQFTDKDRKFTAIFAAILGLIIIGGLWMTSSGQPPTIPLQTGRMWDLSGLPHPNSVDTVVKEIRYHTTERTMTLMVEATNRAERSVVLRKFSTVLGTFSMVLALFSMVLALFSMVLAAAQPHSART